MSDYVRPKPRTRYCGVYAIEHIQTGARYIGGSVDITGRYTHHRFMLRRGAHKTRPLQELWNEWGEGSFYFWTVERCEPQHLREREQAWISATANLLNTVPSAVTGRFAGPSDAKKESARRRWANPEYRAKRQTWLDTRTAQGQFVRNQDQEAGPQGARYEATDG